jgi:hypothetical protein
MVIAICPLCTTEIELGLQPEIGDHANCPECKRDLVITWLYPVMLDKAEDEVLTYTPPAPLPGV